MKFERYYTKTKPKYSYVKRSTEIKDPNGKVIFSMYDYDAPKHWSQTACDILASKYFRKTGVPKSTKVVPEEGLPFDFSPSVADCDELGSETNAAWVFHRMAGCWTYWGLKEGYFDSNEDAYIFYDEMVYILYHQIAAPNSPQWFNTGLHWAYGIDSDCEGHYYVDSKTGELKESKSAYQRPQPHACFIQSVEDSLVGENSIFDLLQKEARLFKYGSGTGTNFSAIRGKGEPLSGGGQSSGLMSFLKIGDTAAGAIKSGGTTRRAAKMVCLDIDHPEIEDFIDWKLKEEQKVAALVKGSELIQEMDDFDSDWQGEAYQTVSGQNSNNSVRVTDEFMRDAKGRVSSTSKEAVREYRAGKLLDKISYAAWACADPGIQFHDTINKWHTCPNDGEIRASNPCSEYMFLDDTACNLASLNLMKFRSEKDGEIIDAEAFEHAVRLWTVTLDISVSMAQFPSKAIAEKSYRYRTLGLGYANLGALLMSQGLPYDSDEARNLCSVITSFMSATSYLASTEMARELDRFTGHLTNSTEMLEVIKKHRKANRKIDSCLDKKLANIAYESWARIKDKLLAFGFRNAQVTVLAPTGTIGLLMDCDTTGIEPDYALVKHKSLAGGGALKIVNQSVKAALEKLEYEDEIHGILEYLEENNTLEGAPLFNPEHLPVFHCANDITPEGHLKMMAAAQPFLSGAISKTINMPESATPDDVKKIYIQAWELGLKAVSIYRNNSKLSQPLTAVADEETSEDETNLLTNQEVANAVFHGNEKTEHFKYAVVLSESELDTFTNSKNRRKLPNKRGGYTQKAEVAGHKIYLRTGEYKDGSLGEIFIDMHKEGATFRALMNNFAIAISIALQHGVPLEKFVNAFTFTKFEPAGLVHGHERLKTATSFLDYIFRDLGVNYLDRNDLAHELQEVKKETEEAVEEKSETTAFFSVKSMTGTDGNARIYDNDQFKKVLAETGEQIKKTGSVYVGDACPSCNSFTLRRNGTCLVCDTCGETTGCS